MQRFKVAVLCPRQLDNLKDKAGNDSFTPTHAQKL